MIFINECKYTVCISVNSGEIFKIKPKENVNILSNEDRLVVSIRPNSMSYKKNNHYILFLKTQYEFKNARNDQTFKITHEKTRVGFCVYYDRLFLSTDSDAMFVKEINSVSNLENIKKRFDLARRRYYLIFGPIETLTGLVVLLFIGGIIGAFSLGWKFTVIYFPVAYIFVVTLNWICNKLSDKVINLFAKKMFDERIETDKEEFYKYIDSKFINEYYLDDNRDAFMGKVERD